VLRVEVRISPQARISRRKPIVTLSFRTSRLPLPILALALAAFAIGTTEFVIMGILPDVAPRSRRIDPSAGLLVSGYALGVAVGAPLLAVLTARWPRKATLITLMGVFVAGNLVSALAPTYYVLMAGRVVASFAHGSFFGLGAVRGRELVPPNRRAAAIALMFAGLTLANVLGVPLGTLIGQQFGWRATFWAVSAFGVMALGAVVLLVPRTTSGGPRSAGQLGRSAASPGPARTWRLTVFGFGGNLHCLHVHHADAAGPRRLLTGGGVRHPVPVRPRSDAGQHAGRPPCRLEAKGVDARHPCRPGPGRSAALRNDHAADGGGADRVRVGRSGLCHVPGLQMRVVDQARESPTLASTLNIAAFNLGNAGGAWLGGRLIDARLPLHVVRWAQQRWHWSRLRSPASASRWSGRPARQPTRIACRSMSLRSLEPYRAVVSKSYIATAKLWNPL